MAVGNCETISNIMEIMKIGRKTWWIVVINQIRQNVFTTKVLLYST